MALQRLEKQMTDLGLDPASDRCRPDAAARVTIEDIERREKKLIAEGKALKARIEAQNEVEASHQHRPVPRDSGEGVREVQEERSRSEDALPVEVQSPDTPSYSPRVPPPRAPSPPAEEPQSEDARLLHPEPTITRTVSAPPENASHNHSKNPFHPSNFPADNNTQSKNPFRHRPVGENMGYYGPPASHIPPEAATYDSFHGDLHGDGPFGHQHHRPGQPLQTSYSDEALYQQSHHMPQHPDYSSPGQLSVYGQGRVGNNTITNTIGSNNTSGVHYHHHYRGRPQQG
jgi:hypothetical protein